MFATVYRFVAIRPLLSPADARQGLDALLGPKGCLGAPAVELLSPSATLALPYGWGERLPAPRVDPLLDLASAVCTDPEAAQRLAIARGASRTAPGNSRKCLRP